MCAHVPSYTLSFCKSVTCVCCACVHLMQKSQMSSAALSSSEMGSLTKLRDDLCLDWLAAFAHLNPPTLSSAVTPT